MRRVRSTKVSRWYGGAKGKREGNSEKDEAQLRAIDGARTVERCILQRSRTRSISRHSRDAGTEKSGKLFLQSYKIFPRTRKQPARRRF